MIILKKSAINEIIDSLDRSITYSQINLYNYKNESSIIVTYNLTTHKFRLVPEFFELPISNNYLFNIKISDLSRYLNDKDSFVSVIKAKSLNMINSFYKDLDNNDEKIKYLLREDDRL